MLIQLRVEEDGFVDPDLGVRFSIFYFDTDTLEIVILYEYDLEGADEGPDELFLSQLGPNSLIFKDPLTGTEWYYDGDGGVYSIEVPLEPEMDTSTVTNDYGPRFRLEYTRWDGILVRDEIWKKNYTGAIIDVDGGKNPFVLNRENEDQILATFRGSTAVLTLISDVSRFYYELFEAGEREYVLRHYVDNELNWTGWILPDIFNEPYGPGPYTTRVRFADGIAMLKNIPTPDINDDGYKGLVSEKDVIIKCLNTLAYDMNVKMAIHIYEENMNPNFPAIEQSFVNMGAFLELKNAEKNPLSCYDALDKVLKSWNAVVFQENNFWYVIREPELFADTIVLDEYDFNGMYAGSETVNLPNTFNDLGIRLHGATLETVRASNAVTFVQEFGGLLVPNNNFALNGSFENWDVYQDNYWKASNWNYRYLAPYPFNLIGLTTGFVQRIEERLGIDQTNNYAKIRGLVRSFSDTIGYMYTVPQEIKKELGNVINISFRVKADTFDRKKELVEAYFAAVLKIGEKYLALDEDDNYIWQDTLNFLRWRVGSIGTWESVAIENIPIPEDGQIEFRACQMVQIGRTTKTALHVDWDDININLASNEALLYKNIYYIASNPDIYTDKIPEVVIKLGDVKTIMSQNAKVVNGQITANWGRQGIDEDEKIIYILTREYLNQYQRTTHKLSGGQCRTALSMIANYTDTDVDANVKYILTGGSYEEKSGQWNPFFHEINQTETDTPIREVAENATTQGASNGAGTSANSGENIVVYDDYVPSTGDIMFDIPRKYGYNGTPVTGNKNIDVEDGKEIYMAKMLHTGTAPVFTKPESVTLHLSGGTHDPAKINEYLFICHKDDEGDVTRISYSISPNLL